MFKVTLIPEDARILIECWGFWDVPCACAFRDELEAVLRAGTALGRPLRMLADLSEHAIQDSRVSDVNAQAAHWIQQAPVERYALVIHSALLRLQARRLLNGIAFEVFDSVDPAAQWLGWPAQELDSRLHQPRLGPPSTTQH